MPQQTEEQPLPATPPVFDLHCHPSLKPYSRSFALNEKHQHADPRHSTSLWRRSAPRLDHKAMDIYLGLPRYRQSSLSSALRGGVSIMVASVVPMELGFVRGGSVAEGIASRLLNYVAKMGKERIREMRRFGHSYFRDTQGEYDFMLEMHNQVVTLPDGKRVRYRLADDFRQIEAARNQQDDVHTIMLLPSIEGGNAFDGGHIPYHRPIKSERVLRNVEAVQNWPYRPVYVTLCHHFYNHLAGHELSFTPMVGRMVRQTYGAGSGITRLGYQVIDKLLEKDKRIYIDVKHLCPRARQQYYAHLRTNYAGERIPIIASHGAVTGRSFANPEAPNRYFNPSPLNFYDDELELIAETGGLLGLQLDQRRIASDWLLGKTRLNLRRRDLLRNWSKLVWYNMAYMAQHLDQRGLPAWDNICLGSDFDGVINAMNGYWSLEQMPDLHQNLLHHARAWQQENKLSQSRNQLEAEEILHRFFIGNAERFLQEYLHRADYTPTVTPAQPNDNQQEIIPLRVEDTQEAVG